MSLFLISSAVLAVATVCLGFVLVRRAQVTAPEGFEDADGFHTSLPPAREPLAGRASWAA